VCSDSVTALSPAAALDEGKYLFSSSRTRSSVLTCALLYIPSSRPSLTTPATAVAVVCEQRSFTITPCHYPRVKLPASVIVRPTAPVASSFAWSSPWTAASGPPLIMQPTPRAPPGYHAPPRLASRLPRPPYQPIADVLPRFNHRRHGECYSGEPLLPDAPTIGSPPVGLRLAASLPT
jgi:hypothetical protein